MTDLTKTIAEAIMFLIIGFYFGHLVGFAGGFHRGSETERSMIQAASRTKGETSE